MQLKPLATRAVPALMLIAFVAACSRGPEPEPAPKQTGPEVIVIAQDAPPPTQAPEQDVVYPRDVILAGMDERLVEDAREYYNEDPTDKANNDLAENPNFYGGYESPHPNKSSSTSAVGIGGGVGGGGSAGGGRGGFAYRRARGGGGRPHADRSRASLEWLKDHQNREGFWSSSDFASDTKRTGANRTSTDDTGWQANDVFVTSLAALAFVGAGYDHKEGDYRAEVRSAILFLRKVQQDTGAFVGDEDPNPFITNAAATAALAELYGLSGDQVLKPMADRAVAYILGKQLPGSGWGEGDANLRDTTWAQVALKSAKMAGLEFDAAASNINTAAFLKQMLAVDESGKHYATYSKLADNVPLLRDAGERADLPREDAMWVYAALMCNHATITDKEVTELMDRVTAAGCVPTWTRKSLDFEYWYWGSLAAYQVGGAYWNTWEKGLSKELLENQRGYFAVEKGTSRETLDEHGSWDPKDAWGPAGGRVYSTAINTLNMEVYYRYLRLANSSTPATKKDSDKDGLPDVSDIAEAQQFIPEMDCSGLRARRGGQFVGEFPLRHTGVKAKVSGTLAGTTVTQTFGNPYKEAIEAVYTFPLPNDSAINHFVMEIEGRRIIGIVRPRSEAKQAYEEAKSRGYTASLMEQKRDNVFTQNVANIAVGGEVKVTLTYYQSLKYEDGRYEYVFPMTLGQRYYSSDAGRHNVEGSPLATPEPEPAPDPTPVPVPDRDRDDVTDEPAFDVPTLEQGQRSGMDIDLAIEIESALPIDMSSLRSVAHKVNTRASSNGNVIVALAKADAVPNRDFVLRWSIAGDQPGVGLLTHKDERGGFLDLQFQPQTDPADADVTPREMTFILDVSGSMSGAPSQMSRQVIRKVLDHMHPDDIFNIVYFASGNAQLFESPRANTQANIDAAKDFLGKANPGGGTEMLAGLKRALDAAHDERYLQIYTFLTDGYIGSSQPIYDTIDVKGQDARFFAFGTGSGVNRELIDGIAEHGRGKAIYCLPRDDGYAESAVEEFFTAIDSPVLCDIEVDWNGLDVSDVCPNRINDLFAAEPLHVQARYEGRGEQTIYVRGRVGARHMVYPLKLNLDEPGYNPAIAAIWARAHIHELEKQIGGPTRVEQEITDTALAFNLVSRYTSFLAVDSSRVVGNGNPLLVLQPVEMPENLQLLGDAKPGSSSRSYDVKGWGMTVGETDDGRVLVLTVEDGGAAAEAGMKPGQVLERINGAMVTSLDRLEELLSQAKATIELETSLTDDGQRYDAKFKLPELKTEQPKEKKK